VVAKAKELRGQGMGHKDISAELTRLGYRTRTGLPWKHPQQIVKILRSFGEQA
jgi:hypothetical protein